MDEIVKLKYNKKKTKKEEYADKLNHEILKKFVEPLFGQKTTYMDDLNGIGHRLFKHKFKGVFPSDKIPRLNDLAPYAILNLDNSKERGSHWVAIAKHGNDTYFYDSFGRHDTQIIPNLKFSGNGKILNTSDDAEQKIKEVDCGARCITWLLIFELWGADTAKLI